MDFSHKDFTGRNLSDRKDMSDTVITGSCFSQENPDTHVFPEGMAGVTFVNCNLDNCFIPAGNSVQGGSQRRFMTMPDGQDWLVDAALQPVAMLNPPPPGGQ